MNRAQRDLDGIYTYIAQTFLEPETAFALIEKIEQEILSLDQMPYRWPGRRRGVYANRGYRQMLVKNYTVIYRVDEAGKANDTDGGSVGLRHSQNYISFSRSLCGK